jgi:hypothetical protein
MLAPRRKPPWWIASVAALKTRMKLMGPLARPCVESTRVASGRTREKSKPVPAAGLVDEGGGTEGVEDALVLVVDDGVGDGEDEAGEVLAEASPGVHEGGRVGQEVEGGHHAIEAAGAVLKAGVVGAVEAFGESDVDGDAPEHFLGGLGGAAVFVLEEVALSRGPRGRWGRERRGHRGG